MSLFSRSKGTDSSDSESTKTGTGETRQLMEELYKRNAELAIRNKTLTLLRKLDEISLKTLKTEEMGEEMCSAISEGLGYDLVALSIVDPATHKSHWLSINSATSWIADAIKTIDFKSAGVVIAENPEVIGSITPGVGHFFDNSKVLYPDKLIDSINQVSVLYKTEPTRNSLVYALQFGDQLLGILIVSSNRSLKDVSVYEQEAVAGMVGLIALALYKAQIYEQLQDLTHNLQQKVDEQTAEVKSAYEVERKARVELQALDKNKDQFILATQHHLRTPLTIIKGYMESLLTTPPQELKPETKALLDKVNTATDRLSSLVNELLDISQMQVGKSLLKKEEASPKPIIEEILNDMQGEIDRKKILKTMDVEDIKLSIDPARIKEALTNLIDNAIKYCNEGGTVTVTGMKTIHPIDKNEIYKITIQDTGIGLTEPEIEHAFTQYFERGEEAEKINKTGRGIGLVVTRNIIEAHGGKVYAESSGRNQGSKFIVELPC